MQGSILPPHLVDSTAEENNNELSGSVEEEESENIIDETLSVPDNEASQGKLILQTIFLLLFICSAVLI